VISVTVRQMPAARVVSMVPAVPGRAECSTGSDSARPDPVGSDRAAIVDRLTARP
jgi:hypothetical protein